LGGKTVALGFSAGAVIEGSEASDDRNRAAGDLVARVPVAVITHGRDGESLLLGAMAVAKHPGPLDEVVIAFPWAVIVQELEPVQEVARACRHRGGHNAARVTEAAALEADDALRQGPEQLEVGRAGGSEVTHIRVVHSLP